MPAPQLHAIRIPELLTSEFDLKPRNRPGEERHYRLVITYNNLDVLGKPASRAQFAGDFCRHVDAVAPDGKSYETITWRNIFFRGGGGTGPYAEAVPLPWGENFTYKFSSEDGYDDFPWSYAGIPPDGLGWNFVLLTIDAHFEFDFLRSTRHGAIEQLRYIGDSIDVPDSDVVFNIPFPPVVKECRFHRREYKTTLAGVTQVNGIACAMLNFFMGTSDCKMTTEGLTLSEGAPADSPVRSEIELTSTFGGTINVRLEDASIESGMFTEYVFSRSVGDQDAGGPRGVCRPEYKLIRIPRENFESGGTPFAI